MIYEMRVYTLQPGGLSPWLKLYEEKALPSCPRSRSRRCSERADAVAFAL
jgi:hypothetical protein